MRLIHAMIRVLDEDRSKRFYRDAFGLDREERFAFDGFTLVYIKSASQDIELELTINHGRSEPYAQGEAYGHLAFVVDDLDAEHRRARHRPGADRSARRLGDELDDAEPGDGEDAGPGGARHLPA